jgi:hypothetical protein
LPEGEVAVDFGSANGLDDDEDMETREVAEAIASLRGDTSLDAEGDQS